MDEIPESIIDIENAKKEVTYPITKSLYLDLNFHAREYPILNLHICPFQIRGSTDRTGLLIYTL